MTDPRSRFPRQCWWWSGLLFVRCISSVTYINSDNLRVFYQLDCNVFDWFLFHLYFIEHARNWRARQGGGRVHRGWIVGDGALSCWWDERRRASRSELFAHQLIKSSSCDHLGWTWSSWFNLIILVKSKCMYVCMTNIYKRKLVYIATWQKYMIVTIHKIIFLITSPQRKVTQLPTVAVLERRSSLFRRPPGYHHLPCGYHHLTGRYQKVQPHTVQVHPQKLLQTSPPQYGMAAKKHF